MTEEYTTKQLRLNQRFTKIVFLGHKIIEIQKFSHSLGLNDEKIAIEDFPSLKTVELKSMLEEERIRMEGELVKLINL